MHGPIHVTYAQHICRMIKILICFYKLSCLSHIFYADFKLQRNKVQSRKLSFAVIRNFDNEFILLLLNEEEAIEEVSLWFYRICILIKGSPRLDPWNAVLQNMEYKGGYSEIRLTTWLQKQLKRNVLEVDIIRCIRCNLSPHCYF